MVKMVQVVRVSFVFGSKVENFLFNWIIKRL